MDESPVEPGSVNAELSRHFDLKLSLRPMDAVSLHASTYLKDMENQIQLGITRNSADTPLFTSVVHTGEGRSFGAFGTIVVGHENASCMSFTYAYSSTNGTSSHRTSNAYEIRDMHKEFLPMMTPLEYEQAHRIVLQGSYVSPADGIFSGLRMWIGAQILSGHRFTRFTNPSASYSVWTPSLSALVFANSYYWAEPRMASRTPWTMNVDASLRYSLDIGGIRLAVVCQAQNLFNARNDVDVHPTTGRTDDDGWLYHEYSEWLQKAHPGYAALYRSLVLQNRWSAYRVLGHDLISPPRQVRIGVEVGI